MLSKILLAGAILFNQYSTTLNTTDLPYDYSQPISITFNTDSTHTIENAFLQYVKTYLTLHIISDTFEPVSVISFNDLSYSLTNDYTLTLDTDVYFQNGYYLMLDYSYAYSKESPVWLAFETSLNYYDDYITYLPSSTRCLIPATYIRSTDLIFRVYSFATASVSNITYSANVNGTEKNYRIDISSNLQRDIENEDSFYVSLDDTIGEIIGYYDIAGVYGFNHFTDTPARKVDIKSSTGSNYATFFYYDSLVKIGGSTAYFPIAYLPFGINGTTYADLNMSADYKVISNINITDFKINDGDLWLIGTQLKAISFIIDPSVLPSYNTPVINLRLVGYLTGGNTINYTFPSGLYTDVVVDNAHNIYFNDLNYDFNEDVERWEIIINISSVSDPSVIDIPGLLFTILTLPFTFFTQAFDLTLFPGTPYAINISDVLLAIICILLLIYIIKLIMSMKG